MITRPFEPEDFPEGEMRDTFREMMARPMYYVLDSEHNVIPLERDRTGRHRDTLMWGEMFENQAECRVAQTFIYRWWGIVWVSTVFLGLDHNFGMSGPPLLFETMAFPRRGGLRGRERGREWEGEEQTSDRYSTWAEAVAGHWEIVERVRAHKGTWREAKWCWLDPIIDELIASWRAHAAMFKIPPIED